ncbi:hypothetical protein [Streptomyces sp. NBC_00470]|uniref:hypothetical protein n=1 Tax=Streptomyces sp. NBC_00470 TaxID=2975753 RepID=UPI0030E25F79
MRNSFPPHETAFLRDVYAPTDSELLEELPDTVYAPYPDLQAPPDLWNEVRIYGGDGDGRLYVENIFGTRSTVLPADLRFPLLRPEQDGQQIRVVNPAGALAIAEYFLPGMTPEEARALMEGLLTDKGMVGQVRRLETRRVPDLLWDCFSAEMRDNIPADLKVLRRNVPDDVVDSLRSMVEPGRYFLKVPPVRPHKAA